MSIRQEQQQQQQVFVPKTNLCQYNNVFFVTQQKNNYIYRATKFPVFGTHRARFFTQFAINVVRLASHVISLHRK